MEDFIGNDFIAAAMKEKSFGNVKEEDLFGSSRDAYKFLRKYYEEFTDFPLERLLQDEIGIALPAIYPPLVITEERLRKRTLKKSISTLINKAVDKLEDDDPDAARELLNNLEAATKPKKFSPASFRTDYEDRIRSYQESKIVKGLDGYLTPWPSLNNAIVGYLNGEFSAILAYYSGGKSWSSCINAEYLMQQGATVLLVTMEMPMKKFLRRLDSVRYKIPFAQMRRADLGEQVEQKWFDGMKVDKTGPGDIIVADKKTVSTVLDIVDLVKEHKATAVIVDGAYRLQGAGKDRWHITASIIEDIQLWAEKTNIPWIATSQMGGANDKTGKGKKTDPKAWDVRYGKEWLLDPDNVFIQSQTDAERDLGIMNIHVNKVRESASENMESSFKINWDMVAMNFTEIEGDEVDVEEALVQF